MRAETNEKHQTKGNQMTTIGTVLPTAASLKCNELYASRQRAMKESVASGALTHCERRVVGGEVRYYDTTDQYAIDARSGKVLWFQVTANGDFRI